MELAVRILRSKVNEVCPTKVESCNFYRFRRKFIDKKVIISKRLKNNILVLQTASRALTTNFCLKL